MSYNEEHIINLGQLKSALQKVSEVISELPGTDEKVKQTSDTSTSTAAPVLFSAQTSPTSGTSYEAKYNANVNIKASDGTLTATHLAGEGAGINVGTTSGNAVYTTTGGKLTSGSLATNDPTTGSSASLDFIATVSQDAKGKITATKQTVKDMTGADGTNAGAHGLVPAPGATDNGKFLKGDGTWATPTNTDTKVKQTSDTSASTFPILASAQSSPTSGTSYEAKYNANIKITPSTGTVTATNFAGGGGNITLSNASSAVVTDSNKKLATQDLTVSSATAGSTPTTTFVSSVTQGSTGKIEVTTNSVSSMAGADGTNAGSTGLVPAPTATDNTKFLKGDGTWASPSTSDTKVNVTLGTTTKAYLLGTSTTPTATAQAVESIADTGVYLDTTAGHLTATQFNGSGAGINVGTSASRAVYTTTGGKLTQGSLTVNDPTASGNSLTFIDTISENSIGKITATKKTVTDMTGASSAAAGTHGLVPAPATGDQDKFLSGAGTWVAETTLSKGTTTGSGNAVTDISVSGHQITLTKGTTFATKAELDALGNPMNFKGTVGTGGTVTTLPTDAKVGDTYKVITAGTYGGQSCKVGDTIICTVAGTSQTWVVIPSGDEPSGTVTSVSAGSGLTTDQTSAGPITSSGTISHADTSSQTSMTTGGRTYVNSITLDDFGHVTALGTNTETVTNTDTKVKQTSDTSTDSNFPLLFSAQSSPTSGTSYEAKYNANVKVNAKSGTVTATGFSGPLTGNASSATEFSSSQSVALTGDVTGSASSKAGWSIATTLANSGATAGSYGPTADVTGTEGTTIKVPYITVDAKGRVTSISEKTLTNKNTLYNPAALGFGYGECSTAGSTAAKTVAVSGYSIATGGIVSVKFAETISVANATLNINSKGAKSIYFNGAALAANVIQAGNIATFMYDGSNYKLISIDGKDLTGGTFGPTADVTGTEGTTIKIPQITVDNFGRVTSVTERTLTNKNSTYTVGNKALKIASNTGTATQAITVNESSSDRTTTIKGDGTYLSGAVSGSSNAPTVTLTPTDSGVTAGSYGPNANVTPQLGDTITVPGITVDAKGRVTSAAGYTATLPTERYGVVDSTSTSAAYKVTVPNLTSLYEGAVVFVYNNLVANVANATLNVNGLGAKDIYYYNAKIGKNLFPVGTCVAFIYNTQIVAAGCWSMIYTYGTNTTYTPGTLGFGYGTCDTAAATAAKVVTLSGYSLVVNGFVAVRFTFDVPANATMNINTKGAKDIYYNGAAITAGVIKAGDIATFVYGSDTKYHVVSVNSYTVATDEEVTELLMEIFE